MGQAEGRTGKPVCKQESERTGSFCARKSLVVGLTGGIATGKSTVAAMLAELGARVLSADEIVHRLLERGSEVWRRIVEEFGYNVLGPDGDIDRKKLGETVFDDPEKKARLEAITHPPVLEYLAKEASLFRSSESGILILEIPLLVETASLGLVDKVLVVTAEQETQIKRLEKRYCISREQAILRIKSQLPISEKLKHADWVVSTEGALSDTREQVNEVWRSIKKSVAQRT